MATVPEVRKQLLAWTSDVDEPVEVLSGEVLSVRHGSARLFISCDETDDGTTLVDLRSLVLLNVPPSDELYRTVAEASFRFGSLEAVLNDSHLVDLWLTHTLLGDHLDPDGFALAVVLLARTADDVDDQLKSRFGGQRFHES